MTRGLGVAIVVWGCGHAALAPTPATKKAVTLPADAAVLLDAPAPDAAPLDDDPERLAARTIEMLRSCGQTLADAHDCAEAAAKLDAVIDANHDVIAASAHVLDAQGPVRDTMMRALSARARDIAEAGKQLVNAPIAKQCASDPTFRSALDHLRGEP
jgi:hypothetical protein